jgi:probable HAF family extracellular repeat protein
LALICAMALAVCFVAAPAGTASAATAIDLGTLGGPSSEAFAINESGDVVGTAQSGPERHWQAFSWTQEGGMVNLGSELGGRESKARGVNNRGEVIGDLDSGGEQALLWSPGEMVLELGTFPGSTTDRSGASIINQSGAVAGGAATSSGAFQAFLWTRERGMRDLGTLGGETSFPFAINDAGQVVGASEPEPPPPYNEDMAFSWTESGGMVDLGTFGGRESRATAVNEGGEVAGHADGEGAHGYAFVWTKGSGLTNLGTLDGANESWANAINDPGEVVGWSYLPPHGSPAKRNAFLWSPGGGMVDLNPAGSEAESEASAINDAGEVAGWITAGGTRNAFIWTKSRGLIDLGTPGVASEAVAINGSGQVIATVESPVGAGGLPFHHHAVLWNTSPPGISRAHASVSAPTAAALTASVEPKDQSTSVRALYAEAGETWCTSHGAAGTPQETAPQPVGNGYGSSPVEVALEGLAPGTEYCADLVASNEAGTSHDDQVSFSAPSPIEELAFHDWRLSGSITHGRHRYAIVLPTGSSFAGTGERNEQTGTGSISGTVVVPPFTGTLGRGLLHVRLGIALSQAGPIDGSIAGTSPGGEEVALDLPMQLNLAVKSVRMFGLRMPVNCATTEPISLQLTDQLSLPALREHGWSFLGTTTVPRVSCVGGPAAGVLAGLLTTGLSGAHDRYSLTVTSP